MVVTGARGSVGWGDEGVRGEEVELCRGEERRGMSVGGWWLGGEGCVVAAYGKEGVVSA